MGTKRLVVGEEGRMYDNLFQQRIIAKVKLGILYKNK